MSVKIPRPSKGRVILFTVAAPLSSDPSGKELREYTGTITDPHSDAAIPGCVDVVYFNDESQKTIFEVARRHSLTPKANTWRYPPRVEGEIEVSE